MRAGVTIREWDLSTRVPGFPGVYGAIAGPFLRGRVNDKQLTTSETSFLSKMTPNEKVEVGYDLSHYSALAFLRKSNKLWALRAANEPLFGGCLVGSDIIQNNISVYVDVSNNQLLLDNSTVSKRELSRKMYDAMATGEAVRLVADDSLDVLPSGVEDQDYYLIKVDDEELSIQLADSIENAEDGIPITFEDEGSGSLTLQIQGDFTSSSIGWGPQDVSYYDLNSSDGKPLLPDTEFTVDSTNDTLEVSTSFYLLVESLMKVQVKSEGSLPTELTSETDYFVIKTEESDKIMLASSLENAENGIPVTLSGNGTGTHTLTCVQNRELVGFERPCVFIHAVDPGSWSKRMFITIVRYPYGDEQEWDETDEDHADLVKEPDSFVIYVNKIDDDGNVFLVEDHLCSRIPGKQDGYGKNIYVEEALRSSMYIRAKDNDAVDPYVLPKNQDTYLALGKGDDGKQVDDSHMLTALNAVRSKRDVFVTLLMDGGWSTPAYQKQGLISLAEKRKDCFGILTVPISAERSSSYMKDVIKYRKKELNANTSYAGLYTSHVKIQDKYNSRQLHAPVDGYVGAVISETAGNSEIWIPPAGARRGVLNVLDVVRKYDEGEQSVLYDNNINPIDFYPGRGIRIWGQKTLLSRPSSLDRVNVRLLLIVIEPAIAEFLEDFVFEVNDPITRTLAESGINSYMKNIKARRGVYKFLAKCDEENNPPEVQDQNKMNVWLYVQPVKAAEFIRFTTIITRTGASFNVG